MEEDAVGSPDCEVFAMAAGVGEGSVGFADQVRGELAADGVEEGGGDKPARDTRQERGKEEKDHEDANEASAHGLSILGYDRSILMFHEGAPLSLHFVSVASKGLRDSVSLLE